MDLCPWDPNPHLQQSLSSGWCSSLITQFRPTVSVWEFMFRESFFSCQPFQDLKSFFEVFLGGIWGCIWGPWFCGCWDVFGLGVLMGKHTGCCQGTWSCPVFLHEGVVALLGGDLLEITGMFDTYYEKNPKLDPFPIWFPIVQKDVYPYIYIYNRCISIFIFYILHFIFISICSLVSHTLDCFATCWTSFSIAKGFFKTEVQESSVHQWVESPPKCRKIPRREANGSWFWQAMWEYTALLERNMERLDILRYCS